ncbi:hypothetical protein PSDVSF_19240 [Pseudodesulfovibrio sediminis]|uniref:Uncharacterized protein n=2 Tax=Pseudodesulfovibrio sediminis TaxID=2810563 RepID=A0ABM7P6V5_9BACT|nr:hypothetical protein PSDVSF_19240 [Pseudodesulfovibrio sediminis]
MMRPMVVSMTTTGFALLAWAEVVEKMPKNRAQTAIAVTMSLVIFFIVFTLCS